MNRFQRASLVAGASLLALGSAQAQDNVHLTATHAPGGGNVTAFGYYMSPYTGTVDGVSGIRINCVDFFHEVTNGEQWSAGSVNLGAAGGNTSLLASTRNGVANPGSLGSVLTVYQQAAWLTNQFAANPASNANQSIAIQTAIWFVASEYGPGMNFNQVKDYWQSTGQTQNINISAGNTDQNSTGYWVYQTQQNYNNQTAGYYDQFVVLSAGAADGKNAQEFIYATPEPGTFVLIGTGLLMVLGMAVKARRRTADTESAPMGMLA